MQPVYLDNNATTRIDPAVLSAMLPYFTEHFGNASSAHSFGAESSAAIKAAREQVQALIGAEHSHEIVFTSGGTELDNAAIQSALEAQPDRNEIVISAVEHPAVLSLAMHLHRTRGVAVRVIPVDSRGRLDIAAYKAALGPKTAIASIMWANNETGVIFPVAELAEIAHEAGVLFHTDAVQAAGRIPIDLAAAKIGMLSLSAHKFHGPKGIGALYVRKGVRFNALIRGGKQERGRRGARRTHRRLPGSARRRNWLASGSLPAGASASGCCATALSMSCLARSTAARSRAAPEIGCRTRPTSFSNAPTAKRSCSGSTRRASPPRPARPARPARRSLRMCCAP